MACSDRIAPAVKGEDTPLSESTPTNKTPANFLTAFDHYIRVDISLTATNPRAPFEVLEVLYERCAQLAHDITSSAIVGTETATLWPSLFAFSEQEARNSAEAKQLRGCFMLGLTPASVADDGSTDTWSACLKAFENGARSSHVFVDEPRMPALSARRVKREELGPLVQDRHMWSQHGRHVRMFSDGAEHSSSGFHVPEAAHSDHADSLERRKLRPTSDVLHRLRWDADFDEDDYSVVYLDRFVGYLEVPMSKWKSDISDDEFIPQHRITGFRRISSGEVVWSRETRLDKIFNGGGG